MSVKSQTPSYKQPEYSDPKAPPPSDCESDKDSGYPGGSASEKSDPIISADVGGDGGGNGSLIDLDVAKDDGTLLSAKIDGGNILSAEVSEGGE